MSGGDGFNPADIGKYAGCTFVVGERRYGVTADGKFTGRESIEGAPIERIAGLMPVDSWATKGFLDEKNPALRERLSRYIEERGQEPSAGLCLAVSLTPEAAEAKKRHGLITSGMIERIEYPK